MTEFGFSPTINEMPFMDFMQERHIIHFVFLKAPNGYKGENGLKTVKSGLGKPVSRIPQ